MDLCACFHFHETPFTREIRVEDHLSLPHLDEALDGLRRAVHGRMSAALVGPAGTGKTALLRRLRRGLPEARFRLRYVKVTSLSKRDLCREISAACGLAPAGSYPTLVRRLQEHFDTSYESDGTRSVLVLDEAHDLRPDVLAITRILTNFDMDSRLVLSLVLSGQPPLRNLLARPEFEDASRRLAHYATLRLLSRDETLRYVSHRSAIAGAASSPFDTGAVDAIFEMSRGNLRAIDRLALRALEIAAERNIPTVASADVVAARQTLGP